MSHRTTPLLIRFLALLALAHLYVGLRLLGDLPLGGTSKAAAAAALAASCLLIPLGLLGRSGAGQGPRDALAWAGLLAMGLFSSLFVLTLLRDVLLVLAQLAAWAGLAVPMAALRAQSAWAVPALAGLASLAGLFNARRRAAVVDIAVPVQDLPAALHGYSIVQLSDIHVGPTIKRGYVQAIVDAANALAPDLIAVTGDVVDGSVRHLRAHTEALAGLRARDGVYLVTGNHEYYSGVQQWVQEFRRLGLTVLMNEHAVLRRGGAVLVVAGVTDHGAGSFDRAQACDPARALHGAPPEAAVRLLLAHQPRTALQAQGLGYTLQLSGHTHGGQFLPWGWFVRFQQPITAGLHRLGGLWVYVSRGTGYWGPPKRLGAPSEITRLRLVPATARPVRPGPSRDRP
ncbi:metallophosphoesterase [Orrella sp. JC864]|uniref:metallophosphoesterase n=1 Tax=Orrella sp. JC864 TaxID=3120298 RepID=UPI0030098C9E